MQFKIFFFKLIVKIKFKYSGFSLEHIRTTNFTPYKPEGLEVVHK